MKNLIDDVALLEGVATEALEHLEDFLGPNDDRVLALAKLLEFARGNIASEIVRRIEG